MNNFIELSKLWVCQGFFTRLWANYSAQCSNGRRTPCRNTINSRPFQSCHCKRMRIARRCGRLCCNHITPYWSEFQLYLRTWTALHLSPPATLVYIIRYFPPYPPAQHSSKFLVSFFGQIHKSLQRPLHTIHFKPLLKQNMTAFA